MTATANQTFPFSVPIRPMTIIISGAFCEVRAVRFATLNGASALTRSLPPITTATAKPITPSGANQRESFYIYNSSNNSASASSSSVRAGDILTVGDYDGDGKADPAVYRAGVQSVFYYRGSARIIRIKNITFPAVRHDRR